MLVVMEDQNNLENTQDAMTEKLKSVIGARVKHLREKAQEVLSQEELAKELQAKGTKVQQGQIGHIEKGTRLPSVPVFLAIADFYETSLDYVAGRTKNSSSLAAIEEDLQTGGISGRLGDIYKSLPINRQQDVYKFAEALQTIALQEQSDEDDAEVQRFIHAMIDAFERRIGTPAIESVLDELARDFPQLATDLDVLPQSRKKKKD